MLFETWSVVLIVSDSETIYSLVKGVHPDAVFTGKKGACLYYIRKISGGE